MSTSSPTTHEGHVEAAGIRPVPAGGSGRGRHGGGLPTSAHQQRCVSGGRGGMMLR
ncbi:MAG TPA: hypothetical protein VLW53_11165 [Candidatus Eisenbacteria bacterium]|nr:hypothetical protein [Candidatus Eisenbacteria bacterium]